MKKDIHPKYRECTSFARAERNSRRSPREKEIKVEICSQCHPYFTGKQKLVDYRRPRGQVQEALRA